MKINKTDIDTLNAQIEMIVEQDDYQAKFDSEVKKYRQKAQLKGFRKGKTPLSVVKKMYGQQVLAEAVNEQLQKGLFDYIDTNNINILGDPIPSEGQEMVDFDPMSLSDYTFKFDLGLAPEFDLVGASESDSYQQYKIGVTDSMIDDEMENARKRFGSQKEIEDNIEEKDIVTISAFELDDAGKRKKDGHESSFSLMVDMTEDEVKKDLLSKKNGDKIEFDIYTIEKDRDEKYVKKYLLKIEDDTDKEVGSKFEGFIDDVKRAVPAELDQDFFDKYLGKDKATTEQEARDVVKSDLSDYFANQAKSLMYREILEALTEKNEFSLPEDFLKRWLMFSSEKNTAENVEKDFEGFKKNLSWTLIKGKLAKEHDVKVEPDEIKANIEKQIYGYLGQYGMGGEYADQMVAKMMQDRNQVNKVYEEILADKVFAEVEKKINIDYKEITVDEFKDIVAELNKKVEAPAV